MKTKFNICFLGILTLIIVAGCAATQELKTSITSKVSSITSTVDPALVNQLPTDKREGFSKVEFDLNVAGQKAKLAGLKSELAAKQEKYVNYEEDLAGKALKEAEIDYDLVKIEAIISSGLGKKEDNIKTRAGLQSKKLEIQADVIKIKANMETAKDKLDELKAEVAKMDEGIKAMKSEGGKLTDKPAAVPAAADKKPENK